MDEKIRTAIRKIAGNGATQAQVCEIVSVNTNSRTAKVVFNGVEYDVQLAPAIGDQLLQIPEAGSTVFVINGIIVGYSDLSEIWLRGNQHEGLVKVMDLVANAAQSDATILIYGESGTGKGLIAQAIHFNSLLKKGPFIKVNCAALSEGVLQSELFGHEKGAFTGAHERRLGRFELADGGTKGHW